MKPFRFWVQTALPLVYDDSLSYYELLCKVVDYINKFIDTENDFAEVITEYTAKVDEIQKYVEDYFTSTDFQQMVNDAIDQMAESGEFDEIIESILGTYTTDLDARVDGLEDRIDAAEGDIDTLQENMNTLSTTVSNHSQEILDNAGDISSLQTDVGALEDDFNDFKDEVEDQFADIGSLIDLDTTVWEVVFVGGTALGDCFYMYHDNKAILFDCGNDDTATNLINSLVLNGVEVIEAIIVSHWHADHVNGLGPVLQDSRFDFSGCVMYKPHNLLDYSRVVGSWATYVPQRDTYYTDLLTGRGGTSVYPTEGQKVTIDKLDFVFNNLAPSKFNNYYSEYYDENRVNTGLTQYNNFCMITSVYAGQVKAVFPGDIQPEAEAQNREVVVGVKLYKVEHHGLNKLTDNRYLRGIDSPVNVLGSYGENREKALGAKYPTINRCEAIGSLLCTDDGTMTINFSADGVTSTMQNKATDGPQYVGALGVGNCIIGGDDFNNYIKPGVYNVQNNTELQSIAHHPPMATSGGKLLVLVATGSGNLGIIQMYISANSSAVKFSFRCRLADSGEWQGWKYLSSAIRYQGYGTSNLQAMIRNDGSSNPYATIWTPANANNTPNRIICENGVGFISLAFTTGNNGIATGTAFIDIPIPGGGSSWTDWFYFPAFDESGHVYLTVGGWYNNALQLWPLQAYPANTRLHICANFNIYPDYPVGD